MRITSWREERLWTKPQIDILYEFSDGVTIRDNGEGLWDEEKKQYIDLDSDRANAVYDFFFENIWKENDNA